MMNRKLFAPALAAFAATAGLVFAACVINLDANSTKREPWGNHDGPLTETLNGYGSFDMTVTFAKGEITDIDVSKSNQTPEYGGVFLAQAVPLVIAANDFDLPAFDAMAGATRTKNGFIAAGKAITAKAESGNSGNTGGSGQNPTPVTPHAPWGTPGNNSGYVTKTEEIDEEENVPPEFVTVHVYFVGGRIVAMNEEPSEKENWGARFIPKGIQIAVEANDFEKALFADVTSGATRTMEAFVRAGKAAIADIDNAAPFKAGQ